MRSFRAWGFLLLSPWIVAFPQDAPEHSRAGAMYPIAVWYGGGKARAPMQESDPVSRRDAWKKDLEQIRSLGFPAVKTWVEWASAERTEGRYDLQNLEQLLELADRIQLRVLIQVYVDSAPDWLGEKYPDSRFVAQNGSVIPSQAAPGFCADHPDISRHIRSFYRAVAKTASRHASFYAYDLWSEPHIINWAVISFVPDAQFCFCPSTLARFRSWLRSKYISLEQLNAAWYRGFSDWKQVEPPRFGTILSYSDYIDWKSFVADKLADDLKARFEAVKSVDPDHPATSHAAVPSIFTSPYSGDGTPDDWKMSEAVDYYGTSIYPKHSSSAAPWSLLRRSAALDFIRSSGRRNGGYYIGELQAGFGTTGVKVGDVVSPGDLEDWTWSALARGARSISYYAYYPMSSGYESGGYGLIELDGTLTPRSRRAGAIASLISRNANFFLHADPPAAEAAILYNPLAHLVGGEQSGGIRGGVRDSLLGYYRPFMDRNIPVDFVHAEKLQPGDLERYKLLIVPYAPMLSTRAAEAIQRFVQSGGRVLAEARTAWNNERGWATDVVPGGGLHETFGCREVEVRPKQGTLIRLSFPVRSRPGGSARAEASAGGSKELEIHGALYEEVLRTVGPASQVIGRFGDGSPAMILNRTGKGATVFVGTFLGMRAVDGEGGDFDGFLAALLDWAGIMPPLELQVDDPAGSPEVRILEHGTGRLLLVFNRDKDAIGLTISLRHTTPAKSLEIWTDGTSARLEGDGAKVRCQVPAGRVGAILVR